MWLTIALISVFSIAAVGYVILPLFGRTRTVVSAEREELADLITRKEVALEAIRELEFDHGVGKIENADFERFNRILRLRAIRLIERIETEFGGTHGLGPDTVQLDERLELEISERRRVEEQLPNEGCRSVPQE
ncbi:MAG: hypothetical protein OXJ55_10610 [Caldilineaceae bacterium]|nr:hypothetical protein [Caldilineaceae bacterium]